MVFSIVRRKNVESHDATSAYALPIAFLKETFTLFIILFISILYFLYLLHGTMFVQNVTLYSYMSCEINDLYN